MFVVMRSGVVFLSEMTLVALIICTELPVGASFVGWLLAGRWALLLVTLECPGLDVHTVPARLNWAFFLASWRH